LQPFYSLQPYYSLHPITIYNDKITIYIPIIPKPTSSAYLRPIFGLQMLQRLLLARAHVESRTMEGLTPMYIAAQERARAGGGLQWQECYLLGKSLEKS